ncbi:MAG TPA: hypothetical protein VNU92_16945 [Edaphobacter sp.]|jgi:hypothetical protein|nr:hypothetical protein [Edaphobacter sp.]
MRLSALALSLSLAATGCHSAYIQATVSNRTNQPLALVEVDYPSASFGTQALTPGSDFHYRFKVLGSGNLKLIYTDALHQEHTVQGPFVKEGAEGPLTILITNQSVMWQPGPTVVPPPDVKPR